MNFEAMVFGACQYVGRSDGNIGSFPLGHVVRSGQRNNLVPLDHLRCRMGVLRIPTRWSRQVRGESEKATRTWNLRERVSQHLRPTDAGGNFRINWYRRHGCDLAAYEEMLRRCDLWVVSFPDGEDAQKIARLEHLLIGLLGPRYCDVPTP